MSARPGPDRRRVRRAVRLPAGARPALRAGVRRAERRDLPRAPRSPRVSAVDTDARSIASAGRARRSAPMPTHGRAATTPSGRADTGQRSSARSSARWCSSLLFIVLWEYFHRDGMRRFFDKPGFLLPSLAHRVRPGLPRLGRPSAVHRRASPGPTFAAVDRARRSRIVLGIALAVADGAGAVDRARRCTRTSSPLQALPVLAIVPLINSVFGGGHGRRASSSA